MIKSTLKRVSALATSANRSARPSEYRRSTMRLLPSTYPEVLKEDALDLSCVTEMRPLRHPFRLLRLGGERRGEHGSQASHGGAGRPVVPSPTTFPPKFRRSCRG